MDSCIKYLTNDVVKKYSSSLEKFRPCRPGSEPLEQNLVTLLSHSFLTKHQDDGLAFSEIPFKSKNNPKNWSSRLDAFLANSTDAYLVEAKSSKNRDSLLTEIKADLERIYSVELKESFYEMASAGNRSYRFPKRISGVIIADFWSISSSKPWFTEDEFEKIFSQYSVKSKVSKIGDYGRYSYFLLVAQTKLLDWESDHDS